METSQTPAVAAGEPASPSRASIVGAMIVALLAQVAILDAAVETVIGGSPMRWWIAAAALLFVASCVLLWRPGGPLARRTGWPGAAAVSIGGLALLVAASAWGPGGLAEGVRVAGQPTAVVLSVLSLCAVAWSAVALLRARVLPLGLRLAGTALAAYALAGFALGVVRATPYPALFRGAGFWTSLPAWLQGPFIGTVVVLPLGVLALVAAWLKARRTPAGRPAGLRSSVVLAAGFTTGVAAILAIGRGEPDLDGLPFLQWRGLHLGRGELLRERLHPLAVAVDRDGRQAHDLLADGEPAVALQVHLAEGDPARELTLEGFDHRHHRRH